MNAKHGAVKRSYPCSLANIGIKIKTIPQRTTPVRILAIQE
jgi:hypothetical protein